MKPACGDAKFTEGNMGDTFSCVTGASSIQGTLRIYSRFYRQQRAHDNF